MDDKAPDAAADPFAALLPLIAPYLEKAEDPTTITADDPRYSLIETAPLWTAVEGEPGTYSRPTVGSEQLWALMKSILGELLDVALGVAFRTRLDDQTMQARLLEGIARLRYNSPLVAASLKRESETSLDQDWSYKCAPSYEVAQNWARQAFHVVNDPITMDEFTQVAAQKIPEVHEDGQEYYFAVYLLTNLYPLDGKKALFVYGAHCMMDGHSGLEALYQLMSTLSAPESGPSASALSWGSEWKNLPPASLIALGGLPKSFKTEGLDLLREYWKIARVQVNQHSLKPQRSQNITAKAEYLVRVIDAETSSKLLARLKVLKFSPTTLIDAAKAMAELTLNPPSEEERENLNIRYGVAVSLRPYLVCDPRTYITSSLTFIANDFSVSAIPRDGSERDNFVAVMTLIKEQYDYWARQPLLPFIGWAQLRLEHPIISAMDSMSMNMNVGIHSSMGLIDRILPMKWKDAQGQEVMRIEGVKFGHRKAGQPPAVVSYTLNGKMHIQVMYGDHWNTGYIDYYLDEIERNMKLILNDPASGTEKAHL